MSSSSFISIVLVLGSYDSSPLNVRLQPFVEVGRTPHTVDDCHDQQQQCNDGKSRQTLPRGYVVCHPALTCIVHAHQLEQKVGHGCKVEEYGGEHSSCRLASCKPCCREQDEDGNRNGRNGEIGFDGRSVVAHYDNKLDREAEEEEEVKLEEGNVNLLLGQCIDKDMKPSTGNKPGR
jgi:hypothetical protein